MFKATLNKPLARRASRPRAVCVVANARHSPRYGCALRLASHPAARPAPSRGPIQRRLEAPTPTTRAFTGTLRAVTERAWGGWRGIVGRFLNVFRQTPARTGAVLLLFLMNTAHADLWVRVDERGVAHFASEQVDARYELFYRGPTGEAATGGFDTREGVAAGAVAVAEPSAAARKLVTWFDVSPGYKAVRHHLREAAQAHGLEPELLQALIATESGFDAQAVSPRGAIGLMQLMPATAARYGVVGDARVPAEKKLTDPRTNIRAGSRYLADLIARFSGQLDLALAAYNAGEGAVERAGRRIPDYPETRNYVRTVLQLYEGLKPPAALAAPAARRPVERVRITLPAGRANMISGIDGGRAQALAAAASDLPPQ